MIVTRYSDGSEGYEFEIGDPVYIADCIAYGSWLRRCVGSMGTVERREKFSSDGKPSAITDIHEVRYTTEWGPARCFGFHLLPTPETKTSRVIAATS